MRAINHALTGAIIGLSISQSIVALPLAFLSHFALDALPHYDSGESGSDITTKSFMMLLIIDMLLCILVVAGLLVSGNPAWLQSSICAFLATSPDLMWLPGFVTVRRGGKDKRPTYLAARFHAYIQWFTKPIGAPVEIVWAAGAIFVLAKIV